MNCIVSIIIPTFNRKDLLPETLVSVQNQTLKNWECIIIDDGSIDGTEEVVKEFIETDKRFQYHKRPQEYSKGACSCRNFGFGLSKGKYIQWLDDDDLFSEDKLDLQVAALEKFQDFGVFATCSWDLLWPDKKLELKNPFSGREIKKEDFFKILAQQQSFIPPIAYLIPRELTLRAGEWNIDLNVNDDAEYFTRILLHSKNLINIKETYVLYREHESNRLSRKRSDKNIESFFLSMRLMQAYLKNYNIEGKAYFKWKLLKWLLVYHRTHPEILKIHYFLFKENGINLNWAFYYRLKHRLYKKIYPLYKRKFKNKKF